MGGWEEHLWKEKEDRTGQEAGRGGWEGGGRSATPGSKLGREQGWGRLEHAVLCKRSRKREMAGKRVPLEEGRKIQFGPLLAVPQMGLI